MMLGFRYTRRYWEIATTLMRHGFGWVVVKTGLSVLVPFHWGLLGHPQRKERYSGPEHLRMAMGFDFYMVNVLLILIISATLAASRVLYKMWRQKNQ